jgi:hypothetical protein
VEAHGVVRRRGLHIFYTIGTQMAVRFSTSRAGRPLPPSKIPSTHFCQRMSRHRCHIAAGMIRSTVKSNDLMGNRTRVLSSSSTVPQPTTLPRASRNIVYMVDNVNLLWIKIHWHKTKQFSDGVLYSTWQTRVNKPFNYLKVYVMCLINSLQINLNIKCMTTSQLSISVLLCAVTR